jgi:phosphoribosylformylglycinamidine synthase
LGAEYDLSSLNETDTVKALFNENIAVVFQADASVEAVFAQNGIEIFKIGRVEQGNSITIKNNSRFIHFQCV